MRKIKMKGKSYREEKVVLDFIFIEKVLKCILKKNNKSNTWKLLRMSEEISKKIAYIAQK
jgi:hypothetical protein